MNHTQRLPRITLWILTSVAALAGAQEIDWHSIDGGGGVSEAGSVRLTGVVGQSDTHRLRGGTVSLSGGYLPLPADSGGLFKDSFE